MINMPALVSLASLILSIGTIVIGTLNYVMIMQVRLEGARAKAERLEQERKDRHEMRNEIQALVMPLEIKLQQLEVAVARLDGRERDGRDRERDLHR